MLSEFHTRSGSFGALYWATCLFVGFTWVTGCARQEAPTASSSPRADDVMKLMLSAYRHANHYQDRGVVQLRYRRNGKSFEDHAPLAVSWQTPNRLRVQAYQVDVACDGKQLLGRIQDEATQDFDGQIIVRDAPERLTLRELWEDDENLSLAFRQGLAGYPMQLDLLLSEAPLAALMEDGVQRTLLEPAKLDGNACYRVNVATADGAFVLWVDQECFVLRRVEYPAATFAPEIDADKSVRDLHLTVEFRAASFAAAPAESRFAYRVPTSAKRVKRLIPPPRELPSDLFGKTTAPFAFTSLSGQPVSNQTLGDRIKVLVWFNNHPACESTIEQVNQVYQQYKSNDRIAIQAVCAEASSFSNQQLAALAQSWHVDLPMARDPKALGRDLFKVPWAPTVVVLDANNIVQIYEVGANPNLVAELPQVLEQLLAGHDVAAAILDQFRQQRTKYERALQRGEPEMAASTANGAAVASVSAPKLLQLRPLWNNTDLQATGNIHAVHDTDGALRFLVHEGWRTLTEIGAQGNLLARHELDLPAKAAVSQVQTAVDSDGQRYFVAWSLRSPQVHVFDSRWNRTLSYPPAGTEHEGVQDAMLADLDGDGQLELHVGFWGTAGVHCVTLSGNRLWNNQDVSHVMSLMTSAPNNGRMTLWVSSASGAVVRLDHHGRGERLAQHTGLLIHHLFRGTDLGDAATDTPGLGDSAAPYCGISYGLEGRRLAIGLSPDAKSLWRYNLPAESFSTQVRFVTSARLLDDHAAHWMIAGGDGSLHIISQDGRFADHFGTGKLIAGMAGGRLASAGVIVVSTPDGVQAWQVSPPATARVTRSGQ